MVNYAILLVEDEPAYHAIVSVLLSARGVTLDWVGDGLAGIEAARARRYDLILMDIEMPGIDGFAAAAAIRAETGSAAGAPIIAFTSLSPERGERHFLDRGFDGWLAKPFRASTFHATLDSWLGQTVAADDDPGGPENRLGRLLGQDGARAMIERFHSGLTEAIAAIDGGADMKPLGHRIGGLAGTLGFPALSAGWLGLQHDVSAWPTVRTLTIEALESETI